MLWTYMKVILSVPKVSPLIYGAQKWCGRNLEFLMKGSWELSMMVEKRDFEKAARNNTPKAYSASYTKKEERMGCWIQFWPRKHALGFHWQKSTTTVLTRQLLLEIETCLDTIIRAIPGNLALIIVIQSDLAVNWSSEWNYIWIANSSFSWTV